MKMRNCLTLYPNNKDRISYLTERDLLSSWVQTHERGLPLALDKETES